jgi:hypothetical protein
MSLDAVKAQYEKAYEAHAVAEQLAAIEGTMAEVEQHHRAALLLSWSLVAEIDDKPPKDKNRRDWCYCANCLLAQFRKVT